MSSIIVAFEGWSSSTQGWGEAGWGQGITVPEATASVGSVTVVAEANVVLTGQSTTLSLGDVTVAANAVVTPSGEEI